MESERDQNRALADAGARKHQHLRAILPEVCGRLEYHFSVLRYSKDIFRYKGSRALPDYLGTLFDAVHDLRGHFTFLCQVNLRYMARIYANVRLP